MSSYSHKLVQVYVREGDSRLLCFHLLTFISGMVMPGCLASLGSSDVDSMERV